MKKLGKTDGFKDFFLLILVCMGGAGVPGLAWGEEDSAYKFDWLDPDKKIYVLQNRRYLKTERVMASLLAGVGVSNPYRSTKNIEPRVSYYFSEAFGVEAFYTATGNSENNTYRALSQSSPSALPVVRETRSQIGLIAQWAPWYAKINVFNKILYFDWYFSAGLGSVRSELDTHRIAGNPAVFVSESHSAFFLGTGHQVHLDETWVVRLDFMGAFYRAPLFGTSGENTWVTNYNFNIGLGVRL